MIFLRWAHSPTPTPKDGEAGNPGPGVCPAHGAEPETPPEEFFFNFEKKKICLGSPRGGGERKKETLRSRSRKSSFSGEVSKIFFPKSCQDLLQNLKPSPKQVYFFLGKETFLVWSRQVFGRSFKRNIPEGISGFAAEPEILENKFLSFWNKRNLPG